MKLLCLNAFEYLQQCYPMFHAVCGFSATLTPTTYFQQALGLSCEDLQGLRQSLTERRDAIDLLYRETTRQA